MTIVRLTLHAMKRAQQRGYREADIQLIAEYGTLVGAGVVLLRSDAENAIKTLEHALTMRRAGKTRKGLARTATTETDLVRTVDSLRRLARKQPFVPSETGHALTVYPLSRRKLKKILGENAMRSRR